MSVARVADVSDEHTPIDTTRKTDFSDGEHPSLYVSDPSLKAISHGLSVAK